MADNDDLHITVTLDDSNIDKRLKKLAEGIDRVGDATINNGAKLDAINANLRRMTDELNRNVRALHRNYTGVRRLRGEYSLLDNTLTRTMINLGMMEAAFHSVSIILFGWQKYILDAASNVEKMTIMMRQLSTAADPTKDAIEQVAYVLEFAKNAPHGIDAIRDSFIKLKVAGLDPAAGSMKALVDANAAFGGNDETLKRASVAIQQMVGKGVVSMEELRQQLGESVPEAMKMMARGLGVSMSQLVKVIESGRLEAKPAIDAMIREFKSAFGGAASELLDTYEGQLEKFKANMEILAGGSVAGGENGYYSGMKSMLKSLNAFLESPAGTIYAKEFGEALARLSDAIIRISKTLYDYNHEVKLVGEGVLAVIALMAGKTLVMLMAAPFVMLVGWVIKAISGLGKLKTAASAFKTSSLWRQGSFVAMFGGRALRSVINLTARIKVMLPYMAVLTGVFAKINYIMPTLVAGLLRIGSALTPLGWVASGVFIFWDQIKDKAQNFIDKTVMAKRNYQDLLNTLSKTPEKATVPMLDLLKDSKQRLQRIEDAKTSRRELRIVRDIHDELISSGKKVNKENMLQSEAFMAAAKSTTHYNGQLSGSIDRLTKLLPLLQRYTDKVNTHAENMGQYDVAIKNSQYFIDKKTIEAQYKESSQTLTKRLADIRRETNEANRFLQEDLDKNLKERNGRTVDQIRAEEQEIIKQTKKLGVASQTARIGLIDSEIAEIKKILNKSENELRSSPSPYLRAYVDVTAAKLQELGKLLRDETKTLKDYQNAILGIKGLSTIDADPLITDDKRVKQGEGWVENQKIQLASLEAQLRELETGDGSVLGRLNKRLEKLTNGEAESTWSAGIRQVASDYRTVGVRVDEIKERMTFIKDFRNQTKDAIRFVDKLGIVDNTAEKMVANFSDYMRHFEDTITNFGTAEFNFISSEDLVTAEKLLAVGRELYQFSVDAAIKKTTNRFTNTYLKQYRDSLDFAKGDSSLQEQLNSFESQNLDEQRYLQIAIKETAKTQELQQAFIDLLNKHGRTYQERKDAFFLKKSVEDMEKFAPILMQLREQALESSNYMNQETIAERLSVFDHSVGIERLYLKEKLKTMKEGTARHALYVRGLIDLDRMAARERIELSRSGFNQHFDQYTNRTEQMSNVLIDSFEGVSTAINDSLYRQEDGWKQLGHTILEQIGNLILMRYVLKPIAEMVENMANSGVDNLFKGLGWLGDLLGIGVTSAISGAGTGTGAVGGSGNYGLGDNEYDFSVSAKKSLARSSQSTPYSSVSKSSSTPQAVTVNMTNKSGHQLQSKAMQRVTDNGRQQVIDIVLDEMNRPGEMRNGLRGF